MSKFSFLQPLRNKTAQAVADAMTPWFFFPGPPKILQCDNGGEFKGCLLIILRRHGVVVVNGNPRKPTTQGLVEQANGTVESRIRGWLEENQTTEWANGLLEIAWSINTTQHSVTKLCPYQLMFGNRMPYLGPNNWLLHDDRAVATVPNEDGNPPDNERSINFQTHVERSFLEDEDRDSLLGAELPGDSVHSVIRTPSFSLSSTVQAELAAIDANPSSSYQALQQAQINSPLQFRPHNTNPAVLSSIFSGNDTPFSPFIAMESSSLLSSGTQQASAPEASSSSSSALQQASTSTFTSEPSSSAEAIAMDHAQRQTGIDIQQIKARERLKSNRKRMAEMYSKKHKPKVYGSGAIVAVKVPDIDRASPTDAPRIYARVIGQR